MIILDENVKSEAQLRLAEKLKRDRKKLQEQIKKDHRHIVDMKRKSKGLIGDLFEEHLTDFYNFEAAELKDIIDTAMTQKAAVNRIASIRKAAGVSEPEADEKENDASEAVQEKSDDEAAIVGSSDDETIDYEDYVEGEGASDYEEAEHEESDEDENR